MQVTTQDLLVVEREAVDDALNLMRVLYSLISISFAVEAWRQPHVPDSGAAYLDLVLEPKP